MASTQVEVANMALGHIGLARIATLAENSTAARAMQFWLPSCIREALTSSYWTFARAQQALAMLTNDRPETWTYKYDVPTSMLKVVQIIDPIRPLSHMIKPAYQIDSGAVYTNVPNAIMRFMWENTSPASWPEKFTQYVAYLLARDACIELTKKYTMKDTLTKYAEMSLGKAVEADAGQEFNSWDSGNAYIAARGSRDAIGSPWDNPSATGVDGSLYWQE